MALIVTLTSTSARLSILRYALLSLLDQSYQPDQIVLCLSRAPYLIDEGVRQLPDWLQVMANEGSVTIEWVENTGPYRKLLPVYRRAGVDDWIVTCDDDVIYGTDWLLSLVQSAAEHPTAVVCGLARRPARNPWGRKQSYINWQHASRGTVGDNLLPIGMGGVLYRLPLLDRHIMLSDDFMELAPKQDDLWFNLARQLTGAHVLVCPNAGKYIYPIEAPGALSETNRASASSGWDKFFTAAFDRFVLIFKGYLGFPVCGNDVAIRRLDEYLNGL